MRVEFSFFTYLEKSHYFYTLVNAYDEHSYPIDSTKPLWSLFGDSFIQSAENSFLKRR